MKYKVIRSLLEERYSDMDDLSPDDLKRFIEDAETENQANLIAALAKSAVEFILDANYQGVSVLVTVDSVTIQLDPSRNSIPVPFKNPENLAQSIFRESIHHELQDKYGYVEFYVEANERFIQAHLGENRKKDSSL